MYQKLFQKRKTIMRSWILSYLLIFLLPLLIFSFSYLKVEDITETEIRNYQQLAIKKLGDDMDTILSNAQFIAYNMAYNPVMQRILNAQSLDVATTEELLLLFNSAKLSTSSVYDFYYYFEGEDRIITSSGFQPQLLRPVFDWYRHGL